MFTQPVQFERPIMSVLVTLEEFGDREMRVMDYGREFFQVSERYQTQNVA